MRYGVLIFFTGLHFISLQLKAQQQNDSVLTNATLDRVVQYAIEKQPVVQQSIIDEKITDLQVKSKLSEWYPQVNFNYLYQHNFQVQTSVIGGNAIKLGVDNSSALQFYASQTIFNRDVIIAAQTGHVVREQAKQQTSETKIDLIVNVSKSFYDVLATRRQIQVTDENITRLQRSLNDARAQYDAGVVDKTDYKRATILLNKAVVSKKANEEALKAKTENLKYLMNYPVTLALDLVYDSTELERHILLDTTRHADYSNRIEYQILQTQMQLQEANVKYNKWSFMPSLSAEGAYNLNYLNNDFGKLYNSSYPNSYAGLTLAFPIFQGGKRLTDIKQAEWELKRTELDIKNFQNAVNSEYTTALAAYKVSLANYRTIKENVELAQEVYDIIELQYRSGIKTYLDVILAEADLRTEQITYFDALYNVMSSKLDVQKSLGEIIP
ncbi:MAG TPA: TolC family protein [Agriterribacter sp.]|nr:TolC family protein [Agriterribacter sp.]